MMALMEEDSLYATVRRQKRSRRSPTTSSQVVLMRRAPQEELLEARFGGREVANAAAAIIQRWYRAARLQVRRLIEFT